MRFVLAVAALVLLSALVGAQEARAQERVALLIGNAEYAHATRLVNPPNDVTRMAEVLRGLGFDDVQVLTDLDEDALEDALLDFGDKARGADTALLFYSGHGMEFGGRNYLIPTDAELRRPGSERTEAVSLEVALDSVAHASRLSVVILDACRDSPPGGARSQGRGFAPVRFERPGLAVAFSTAPGDVAWDGDGALSPYTQALTEALTEDPETDVRLLFTSLGEATTRYAGAEQLPFARFGNMPRRRVSLGRVAPSAVSTPACAPEDARQLWADLRDSDDADALEAFADGLRGDAARAFGCSAGRSTARRRG